MRTPARLDQLTIKLRVSQADDYRALMQLPPDAPMEVPPRPDDGPIGRLEIVMITQFRSWPNINNEFWLELAGRLDLAGRKISLNDGILVAEGTAGFAAMPPWR